MTIEFSHKLDNLLDSMDVTGSVIVFPSAAQIIQFRRTQIIKGRKTTAVVAPPTTVATWIQGH